MEFITGLFDTSGFPARWRCGNWTLAHGWLHILSDVGVWAAYFAIPLVLGYFAARRRDLPFRRVFLLFVAFILLCGTTHLMEAVIFWWPAYRLAGVLKLLTAVVSWVTVLALVRVAPAVLAMRTPAELEREIAARTDAEVRLTEANAELERRVEDRTAELGRSVVALQKERELFRTTLMSIGDGVVTTDRDGRVTELNVVAESLTGWTTAEAQGQPLDAVFKIVNETTRLPVENPALRALKEGKIVGLANHTVLISKDAMERPIDDSAAPIRNRQGDVSGSVLVFRDISERKRTEAVLRERLRLLALNAAVGEALVHGNSLAAMLQRCAEGLVEHLDAAFARIWTLNQQNDVLELRASAGMYTHMDGPHSRVPVGKYKIGLIAQEKKPHLTNEVVGDPRVSDQEWARQEGMVAFAGYPLVVDDRLVGVIALFARKPLLEATLDAMASVADEIAVGVERKTSQERLHEQREWLAVTLASIGDAVITTDDQGRVTFLNGVAQEMTGWTLNDAEGQSLEAVFTIVNEQTRQPVNNPVEKVLREGVIVGLANHTVLIAKDGTERPIDDSAAPIRDSAGKLIGVVLIFRDVTEQRRADQELRSSEARKSAILQTAIDCIITMDHQGRVVEFNPAAEKTFGYKREQVVGKQLADFIIPHSLRERHRHGMAHYLATGEGPVLGQRLELPALHADGTEFPVEIAITRIPTDGPPLFTAYLRDITETKRAEQHRNARRGVTHALNEAVSLDDGAERVLRVVCENLGWDVGFFWAVNDEGAALRCTRSWHEPGVRAEEFETASCTRTFVKGEGLPGRVWATGKPAWVLDVLQDANFPRLTAAAKYDLHSAFACPVSVDYRTLGVIEFFTQRIHEPDADLLEMMQTVAGNFGQFLERKTAEEQVRQSERELADFFENATVGLHWVGADGIILRANRAELDLLGYSLEEYVGRPISDFHADEATICDILNRLQAGEELQNYPARLRCKNGSIRDVLISSNVLWEDGRFVHTRCFTRDVTELKESERQLQEGREQLDFALAAADLGQWSLNLADHTARRTLRHDQLFGYDALLPDWTYETFLAHVVADDRAAVDADFQKAVATGSPWAVECRIRRADGAVRHIWTKALVRRDAGGQVDWMLGIVGDITDRRQAEERHTFLVTLADTLRPLSDPVDVQAEATRVLGERLGANRVVYFEVQGDDYVVERDYSDAVPSVVGRHNIASFGPEQLALYRAGRTASEADVDALPTRTPSEKAAFGAVQIRSYVSVPLVKDAVFVAGLAVHAASVRTWTPTEIAMTEDTAERTWAAVERVRAEQEVARLAADAERQRRLFDTALSNTTDYTFLFDLDGRVVYANRALLALWEQTANQALGKTLAELDYPADSVAQVYRNLRRVIDTGESVRDETPYTGPNAVTGHFEYILAPVLEAGRVILVAGSSRDITDRKRMEDTLRDQAERLRDADRRKDEFLATLAHELRNPLAPIRNGLQVIRMAGANGTIEQARSMMERQLGQMVRLVDDLLDVSRVTTGKLTLSTDRLELRAVIDAAVETTRPVVEQAGHELVVTVPDEPIFVNGDLTRLAQVVSNLLTNSVKYTHRGGHIRLTVERDGDSVTVSVKDDGIGIPTAMLDKVFVMFTQVDRTLEKTTGGLGIGLSLVKGLVEKHGGTIVARSDGEGRGSEFVVTLPVAVPVVGGPEMRSEGPEGIVPSGRRRLLVVDDNRDAADSLAQLLELLGNEVRTANDGEAGVRAVESFRPDVVLMDIGMPKLNGYEACRRIREQGWGKDIVLVALTGWGQDGDRAKSEDAGFNLHLVKPVEFAALTKLLAGLPSATS